MDNEIRNFVGQVDLMATLMERTAERIRQTAQQVANPRLRVDANSVAADILNEYQGMIGNNATRVWGLVRAAGDIEKARTPNS
jgi:hypothetical protein